MFVSTFHFIARWPRGLFDHSTPPIALTRRHHATNAWPTGGSRTGHWGHCAPPSSGNQNEPTSTWWFLYGCALTRRHQYFRSELDDGARRSELDDGARVWSSQNESSSTLSIITVTALFACTLVLPSSGNQDEPN